MNQFYNIQVSLLKYLFPTRCVICGKYGSYLCSKHKNLLTATLPFCFLCGGISSNYVIHESCRINNKYGNLFKNVTSFIKYNNVASNLLSAYKYDGVYNVKNTFIEIISEISNHIDLQHLITIEKLYITEVSQHKFRTNERGFVPTQFFAKCLHEILPNSEYIPGLITKKINNKRQVTVSKKMRLNNIEGVYSCRDINRIPTNGELLLVDDVITTGSTIKEVAITIKKERPDINLSGLSIFKAN